MTYTCVADTRCLKSVLMTTALIASGSLFAATPPDQAYIEFVNALGAPALIGANAEHELANTAYRPVPGFAVSEINPDKLRLGFDLFHERRLSVDNSTGCNTCHSGMFGGTDGRAVSVGAQGALGKLNAPTTFNAAYNFRQFWDGRAVTLADQALGPIENPLEMAHSLDAVLDILTADANYPTEFARVYPDGISVHNMADAIAYFQTVNFSRGGTPFVQHLNGVDNQLSDQALRGWQRFDEIGCVSCHNGINLGGNSYQQLGAALPYFVEHRTAGPNDNGLLGRSGRDTDIHVFKVPTLHGIAETAPYFHDGSIETLEAAIEEMAEHQLGRLLSDKDVEDIAAFLRSLGGRPMGMGMAMGNAGMGRGMGARQGMSQNQGRNMGSDMDRGMGGGMRQGMGLGMGARAQQGESASAAGTEVVKSPLAANHTDMYLESIAAAESAINRLTTEMRRIQTSEVAHYDFLQFEHLELIRHARALQHPPADVNERARADLTRQAAQLLTASNDLEWVIADFLRAQAMIKILDNQQAHPETSELAGVMGNIVLLQTQHQETAAAAISHVTASPVMEHTRMLRTIWQTPAQ